MNSDHHETAEELMTIKSLFGCFHTIMLVKLVDKSAHAIVPQLDDTVVQTSENPGPFRVETQSYRKTQQSIQLFVYIKRV